MCASFAPFCSLQFMTGPGNDSLTTIRQLNIGWDFWYVVSTTRAFVAPKLPAPRHPFTLRMDRPMPVVQAVRDCSEFEVGLCTQEDRTGGHGVKGSL